MTVENTKMRVGAVLMFLCVAAPAQHANRASHDNGEAALNGSGAVLVVPTVADPTLKTEFDSPNVVLMPKGKIQAELVVFLPGTGGKPAGFAALLRTISEGGYRVIGLMYDNKPNEDTVCDKSGDLECHRRFREERFAGDVPAAEMKNTPAEGIDHRLVMLLKYLDRQDPKGGWGQYLADGEPVWNKIIISGHSQGSGHAAYIAKFHEVARAVLFSGPYDGIDLRTAPKMSKWLSEPSKTPMDRWYAEHHENDLGAPIMPLTLAALKVPVDHILVSSLALDPSAAMSYHMIGTHDPRMVPEWKWLFGIPGGVK